jgi:hypothetical protein
MASPSGVIFPASMADFLTNPVDFFFGSMSAESTAPTAYLVILRTAVTSDQQVESDLLVGTHQPTPRDLIAGLDCVESTLFDMIKVCERVKRPCRTTPPSSRMPLGLRNAARAASRYMKKKIQIESGSNTPSRGNCRVHLDDPCLVHKNSKHIARQCCVLKKLHRPLIMTHGRQINHASSPDRGTFQIARTTISPNNPCDMFKVPDREVLAVSDDVPPQADETDEQRQQRENANAT